MFWPPVLQKILTESPLSAHRMICPPRFGALRSASELAVTTPLYSCWVWFWVWFWFWVWW